MECMKIREKLSEYVDEILSPQEKVTMDEHLKSCRECATALAELKKTIEHAKNLEAVEPPAWMTQKIMARVRAEARPGKGLFQKLFYPLYIKLPVGAIATVAIALTTLYIFRTIEPEIKLAKAPTEEAAPLPSQGEEQPWQREPETEKALPMSPQGRYDEKKAVPPKPSEQPIPSREPEFARDRLEAPKATEPMKQAELSQEKRATAPASGKDVSTPSVGALAKEEEKREPAPAAPRMKAMAVEKKEATQVIVHVKNVELAQKEIEKHIAELGGKVVKKESYENKNILTAEMDSEKFKEFFGRVKSVGQVQEKGIDFENAKGLVGVRIEIVGKPEQR
jgi:hypothetical protein